MKKIMLLIFVSALTTSCVTVPQNNMEINLKSLNITYLDKTARLMIIKDVLNEMKQRFSIKSVFKIAIDDTDFSKEFIEKLRYEGYGVNLLKSNEDIRTVNLVYTFSELEADNVMFDLKILPSFRLTKTYSPDPYGNYLTEKHSKSIRSDFVN